MLHFTIIIINCRTFRNESLYWRGLFIARDTSAYTYPSFIASLIQSNVCGAMQRSIQGLIAMEPLQDSDKLFPSYFPVSHVK